MAQSSTFTSFNNSPVPKSSAERTAAYRARRKVDGKPDVTRQNRASEKKTYKQRKAKRTRPFCGCDGEGAGVDELGRQNYTLFRMGDRELFNDNKRLTSEEILDFICDHPREDILVGFAFGYDVTMILRDLAEKQQRRLFEPHTFEAGHSPFTWYKSFDIDYLPKQYFKVRRVIVERYPNGRERRVGVKGSMRTIYETFGFFQKSFVKVINEFDIGTKEIRDAIAEDKKRRDIFETITQRERDYCHQECILLAELMERLRDYCHAAGIVPNTWNGAGKLASALHKLHGTLKSDEIIERTPKPVLDLANMAYYGGRFEITTTGEINQPVYEYDIKSAYPDAMRFLPCLEHGTWRMADSKALHNCKGLYVAACNFKRSVAPAKRFGVLGALPVRCKEGHLYWPLQGSGVYWSPEIESAKELGFKVSLKGGYIYEKHCDCNVFDWVEPLFEYRKSIGSSGPGYPIKLGINSLYGLLAQRKGKGRFVNMVWAGLITALTRTKLNRAIALNPGRIVMCATDAVYSLDPLPLDVGDKLGQWELAELKDLFIVQPGLYWSRDLRKRKSRGLSGRFFEERGRTEAFEKEWKYAYSKENSADFDGSFPMVSVPVPGFIGLRLALQRNKPELAGTWISDHRSISFDYRNKRTAHIREGRHYVTGIKAGSAKLQSLPHRDFLKAGGQEPWEAARLMLDEQPDYIDLGIPFKD